MSFLKKMWGIVRGKRPDVPKGIAKKDEVPAGQANRPTNAELLAKAGVTTSPTTAPTTTATNTAVTTATTATTSTKGTV